MNCNVNSKYLKSIGSYALVDCNFYTWDTISILLNDNMQHLDGTLSGRNIQEQTQRMIQFSLSDAEIYFRYSYILSQKIFIISCNLGVVIHNLYTIYLSLSGKSNFNVQLFSTVFKLYYFSN